MTQLEKLDQCLKKKDDDNYSSNEDMPAYEGLNKKVIGLDENIVKLSWLPDK